MVSAFVLPGVLQSTYTGAQLRAAATMYALMVDGLFGPASWSVVKAKARVVIARRAVERGLASARVGCDGRTATSSAARTPAEAAHNAPVAEPRYDWEPFFQRFGDMLPQDALTSTMAAFGKLMNDFHGYNKASTQPTRAQRAELARQQAEDFALGMVLPLFGAMRSSKLHELLCHAAEEIELRDDFSMADTSANEQKHKEEKAEYRRTNRHTASAGRQLLTVAQARIMLQDEEKKLAEEQPNVEVVPEHPRIVDSDVGSEDSGGSDVASSDEEDVDAAGASHVSSTGGVRVPVDMLRKRQGLGTIAGLLGVPLYAEVSVL